MNIKRIRNIQIIKSLYYTFLNKKIQKVNAKDKMIFYNAALISMEKATEISLNGTFHLGANSIPASRRETTIRMDENSKLRVEKSFSVYYGGDIILFKNAKLSLGSGFFNSNIKIRCTESISIGNDVAISHDVTIMDSDAHEILDEQYQKTLPVRIGNHVWIGTRVTILKGVTIGDDVIIAAGSVVTKDIPSGCLAAGVPARVIRKNVKWK